MDTPSDSMCCHSEFVEQRFDSVCWSQLQRPGDQKSQEYKINSKSTKYDMYIGV